MRGLGIAVAVFALAALPACGSGSFVSASTNTCSVTSAATITPGGGTITFPTVSGASATLAYAADSSIPATTVATLGTTTCFASLATPQPDETVALAFTMAVSQQVDLLSQLVATLPNAPSPVGYYGVKVYDASKSGGFEVEGFAGTVSGTTITFPSGSARFGIIMNANETYVIEVLHSTAPTPPPSGVAPPCC